MILKNSNGESFRLSIKDYEFPHIDNEKWDANWLFIECRVAHQRGDWQATYPCLLTWEVERLIAWFQRLSTGDVTQTTLDFIEPNLEFEIVQKDDDPALRLYFEAELRPDRLPPPTAIMHDLWIQFPLSTINWKRTISSLQEQLDRFPMRHVE